MASYGKTGGFVLAGVGVAASCIQIANADNLQEKNEIFVETVASTALARIIHEGIGISGTQA